MFWRQGGSSSRAAPTLRWNWRKAAMEAWKYTDLANALESELEPATPFHGVTADENEFAALDAHLLLVNGFLYSTRAAGGLDIVDLGAIDADAPDWVKEN